MSDNAGDVRLWYNNESKRSVDQAFWWENVNSDDQDTPTGYWNAAYHSIAVANHALEAIEAAPDRATNYRGQEGEALLSRAYGHFMLVNIFAKAYNPATAATDMGVPYVTKPEKVVFEKYERATIKEVYDNIELDLLKGLELVGENEYSVPKYHFNLQAAYAFACRFYLYKNEYEKAIKYADLCLGDNPLDFLRDMNGKYSDAIYQVFESMYTSADEPCNLLIASTVSQYQRSIFYRYKLSPEIKSNIYDTNVTGGNMTYHFYTYTLGERTIHTPKFKEYFKLESINANYGQAYIMSLLFTADEVLLNRAEAYAMLNTAEGTANAIRDLNYFYSKRIANYSSGAHTVNASKINSYAATLTDNLDPNTPIGDGQMNLMKVIVDTRRKDCIMEGLRWFDIKRHNIVITHASYDRKRVEVLTKGDYRRELQIPPQAISAGITPNPR